MQLLGKGAGAGDGADVGADDDHVLADRAELLGIVVDEDGVAEQVIHRNIEEALDLVGVQVHGQHAVNARGDEHIGNELGGDGIAALGLAVLTGIAEVGHDRGNAARAGAAARIDHDEQLHEAVVDGLAGGLDEEHVAAAHGLIQRDGGLAVREALDLALAELGADDLADVRCELGVGVAGEDLDVLAVRNHCFHSPLVIFLCKSFYFSFLPSRARRRAAHPSLTVCFVRASASASAGTSSVMVEPAAM